MLFHAGGYSSVPGVLLEKLTDPTGAGDCFAGGFIGYLASQNATVHDSQALRRAVVYGCVMGSFCCEEFGVDRFRTLTRDEVEARFVEFRDIMAF